MSNSIMRMKSSTRSSRTAISSVQAATSRLISSSLQYNKWIKDKEAKFGIPKLFDNDIKVQARNIFDFYLEGRYTTDSNIHKEKRNEFREKYFNEIFFSDW